jgi:putative ABC transport system ATP-binding protein
MPKFAIDAHAVTKWFGEGDARTCALRDVSVQAKFGEMLLIVGPSGRGKTTLLSVISGIQRWRRKSGQAVKWNRWVLRRA